MVKFLFAIAFLALGALGALAAVVPPTKLIRFKSPGARRTNSLKSNNSLGIYKGKSTTIQKHPYLVGVLYDDEFLCAGTIISKNHVILSGDCVYGVEASFLSVVAGSKDGSSGKKYSVSAVTVHPNYDETFLDYDFAILKIQGKFKWSKTVKMAKLPKRKAKVGSKAVAAGWGETGSDGTMKEGTMEIMSSAKCEKYYEAAELKVTDRMGCAYDKGKTTLCDSDWADPFVENKVIYQLFVAVGTNGECTSSAGPSINADVFSVKAWVKKTAEIEDEDEEWDEEDDDDEEKKDVVKEEEDKEVVDGEELEKDEEKDVVDDE